ncbi:hypothetical protein PQQ85_46895 [Paraburkholderia sediminicola]
MLAVALCAILCGADNCVAIQLWVKGHWTGCAATYRSSMASRFMIRSVGCSPDST